MPFVLAVWAVTRDSLIVVTAVVSGTLGSTVFPAHPSLGFFEAAAQIIPVLLLVLAVELRLFRVARPGSVPTLPTMFERPLPRLDRFLGRFLTGYVKCVAVLARAYPVFALILMVAGELSALKIVATGEVPDDTRSVGAALIVGLVAIALSSLQPRRDP
jgi:hypothetical protein